MVRTMASAKRVCSCDEQNFERDADIVDDHVFSPEALATPACHSTPASTTVQISVVDKSEELHQGGLTIEACRKCSHSSSLKERFFRPFQLDPQLSQKARPVLAQLRVIETVTMTLRKGQPTSANGLDTRYC